MSPEEVDKLPNRHVRSDGVQEVFKGFGEGEPLVVYDTSGVAFTVHEWADGRKFKERF